ncbi:hypothetical protein FXO38_00005 [Capsicum annuum]|uniref:Uncharacterized protein n=1 Tax=Capsicum annuum TaxID=4072 RepID=A0A2G2YH77_CAPAN|nr:hypothetical protein FXO38_00005 [Capsicum annuum]PHT69108.1 hypothetical protein T459_28595 [Capsicum annuum]
MGFLEVVGVKGCFTAMGCLDGMDRLIDMVYIRGMGHLITMDDIDCLGAIDQMSIIGRQLRRHGLNEQYMLFDWLRHSEKHRPMCHLGAFNGLCLLGIEGNIVRLGAIGRLVDMDEMSSMDHLEVIGGLGSMGQISVMGRCTSWQPSIGMGHFVIVVDLCLFDVVDGVGCLGIMSGMGCLVGRMIIIGCTGLLKGMGRLVIMRQLGGMGYFGALCGTDA